MFSSMSTTPAQPIPSAVTGRFELVFLDRDDSWHFGPNMDADGARHIEDQHLALGYRVRLMRNGVWDVRPDNYLVTIDRCS